MKWTPGYEEWRDRYVDAYEKIGKHECSDNSFKLYSIFIAMSDEEFIKVKEEARNGMAYEILNPEVSDGDFERAYLILLNIEKERGDKK